MTYNHHSHPGEPISVVEDLDPEPGSERGPGPRLDVWLGVPLLLAVILFVGWQWWRQDYQSGQYRAGQEAAGQSDWEAASRYFGEASGYADADALAAGAREKIETRDKLYSLAVDYGNQENWLLVLQSAREAARIQPDFRDLREREQAALDGIYGGILSGTVTLRSAANPPGLYFRTAGGWTYLKGSDEYSAVQTTISNGQFVYDSPTPIWRPPSALSPGKSMIGRYLTLARFVEDDKLEYVELSLDPNYYTQLLAGSNGVWGLHFGVEFYRAVGPVVRSPFISAGIAYQQYSTAPTATIGYANLMPDHFSVDKGMDSAVMYLDRGSNRYLMAEWPDEHTLDVGRDTVVNLYLAEAGKDNKQLIYEHRSGGIVSAQLSPDGRYTLIHTFTVLDVSYVERQSILLIDMQDMTLALTPRLILDLMAPTGDSRGRPSSLGALFVQEGPFAGDIVLSQFLGDSTWVQVLDAAHSDPYGPGTQLLAKTTAQDENGSKEWVIDAGYEEGLLITGHEFIFKGIPTTNTLSIIEVIPGGRIEARDIAIPSSSFPLSILSMKSIQGGFAWAGDQYQVGFEPHIAEDNGAVTVYSAQDGQIEGVINPTLAYTKTFNSNSPSTRPTVVLGERFFAYAHDGQLHLRGYDGVDDITLESGVQAIYAENRYRDYWSYLRR